MKLFTILRNMITKAKAYTDTAEQNTKDYTDTAVNAITTNIQNLTIKKASSVNEFNSTANIQDTPQIMWWYDYSQIYVSFDYYWIRMQFKTNNSGMQRRVIYGNTTGSWTNL